MPTVSDTLAEAWKLHQAGRYREAEQIYRQVLAADANSANAWCYLGIALHDLERYDESLAAYRRALSLQPNFPIAYNNLGNTYRLMRQLDKAVVAFDKAIEQQPRYLIAYKNKATALCWETRVPDALRVYEECVQFAPEDPDIHKHLGIMRLLLGDFAGGWPEYDWRWKTGEIKLPEIDLPLWDGSSLGGKTILLTPEQGLGDTIHFVRYAAWLKERYKNCRILFHGPKALRKILATCAGLDKWLDNLDDRPAMQKIDFFAPLLHIPSVLRHTPADFPAKIPYLTADETLVHHWREKLAAYPGIKIGFAWRGSPTHQADIMRSIPLANFVPLARLKGLHFFSLQKGAASEELNTLNGRLDMIDLGSRLDENTGAFVETAAVMKNLDLVIACDTSVAHVAGALGVPVWVSLCNVPDWRWLASGETTPWYPAMRLFRQSAVGDWLGVAEQMVAALLETFPGVQKKTPTEYVVATSGANRLNRTRDGLILYNRHDTRVGRALQLYGEFARGELDLLKQAIKPNWFIVEAGAGIGLSTLALANIVGQSGQVLAFEHGPLVFQTLCANLALNGITNVRCHHALLGDASGTINIAPSHTAEGKPVPEAVRVLPLDTLKLPRCHFLSINLAGLELRALQGAAKTIDRHHPLLYIAAEQPQNYPTLIQYLHSLGYQLFWHTAPIYSSDNFYENPANEFSNFVTVHIFGIHSSVPTDISGLQKIDSPQSTWRQK